MIEAIPYIVAAFPGVVGILVFVAVLVYLGVEDANWRQSQ